MRLGLDFNATSWLDRHAERTQVERHMRICLAATDGFRMMVTISPSEPLLAEASSMVMRTCLGVAEAPGALLNHINDSYLNAGSRGEVVGALLLLLARDQAIDRNRRKPPMNTDLKHDGFSQGRIVTMLDFLDALVPPSSQPYVRKQKPIRCSAGYKPSTLLEDAFDQANIYFNHFIKVHDFKMVDRKYLWHLFCRGAAVICANNQRGIDIIVPTIMGTVLRPECIGGILIQIKNDVRFTDTLSKTLFDMMDPFEVNLFSKDDARAPLPPVLRIVFALASERSGVVARTPPARRSSRLNSQDKFTAYDLWIAGISSRSFGVILDETCEQYKLLLHRTRNIFDGYGVVGNNRVKRDEEALRTDMRRMMHAAAASEDLHYQNYINLGTVPTDTARNYIVEEFLKDRMSADEDEVMDEDEGEDEDGDEDEDERWR